MVDENMKVDGVAVSRVEYDNSITYGERNSGGKKHGEKKFLFCLHCGRVYEGGDHRPAKIMTRCERLLGGDPRRILKENKLDLDDDEAVAAATVSNEACPFHDCDGWIDADGMDYDKFRDTKAREHWPEVPTPGERYEDAKVEEPEGEGEDE